MVMNVVQAPPMPKWDPLLLPSELRAATQAALGDRPAQPIQYQLEEHGRIGRRSCCRALTGVDANVVVLSGRNYPSRSMKVGPAYVTLAEAEALHGLRPGDKAVIGPNCRQLPGSVRPISAG